MKDYWKKRCLAAEKYIDERPCDYDIYQEQVAAYNEWQIIKNTDPETEEEDDILVFY